MAAPSEWRALLSFQLGVEFGLQLRDRLVHLHGRAKAVDRRSRPLSEFYAFLHAKPNEGAGHRISHGRETTAPTIAAQSRSTPVLYRGQSGSVRVEKLSLVPTGDKEAWAAELECQGKAADQPAARKCASWLNIGLRLEQPDPAKAGKE
jgi:hypothetical protein